MKNLTDNIDVFTRKTRNENDLILGSEHGDIQELFSTHGNFHQIIILSRNTGD